MGRCVAYPRDMSFGIRCCTVVNNCSIKQCVSAQLPIPWNTLYTVDFINEMTADHVCPEGVLTFQDLGVDPRPVRGTPHPSGETPTYVCPEGVLTSQDLGVNPRPVRGTPGPVAKDGTFACFPSTVRGNKHQFDLSMVCLAHGPTPANA